MKKPTLSKMVLATADVAGFAKACHGRTNAQVFAMLDRFYHRVGMIVTDAGGTVVKFMGDCAFIVFPAAKATAAVRALEQIKAAAPELWTEFGVECRVNVHAHLGRVASGPIGPQQRFDVVGTSVNELFMMRAEEPELSPALTKHLRRRRSQ